MTIRDDDILDDLFHGCAFQAYLDQAIEQQGPADSEATRKRAYAYYELSLAEKSQQPTPARTGSPFDSPRHSRYQGTK